MVFHNLWSFRQRLISTISLCLVIQCLISWPLWVDFDRHYPKIPAFPNFALEIISPLDFLFFGLMLFILLAFALGKCHRFAVWTFFFLSFIFILDDINRLQVWVYQMAAILLVLFAAGNDRFPFALLTIRIMIACVYCWSGIHKLNIYFAEDIFPWLLQPFGLEDFAFQNPKLAYATAILESLAGICLLLNKTRKIAIVVLSGMHLFILIVLSPLGHHWNAVVWPWNITMIVLLVLVFYKNKSPEPVTVHETFRLFWPMSAAVVLFGVMPFFNFFNKWDEQLSFKMYSGISPEGIFYFVENSNECIPDSVRQRFGHETPGTNELSIILDDWAFYELKVAPYKSKKRIMQAGAQLCRCIENPDLARLKILEVERWNKEDDHFSDFSCRELSAKSL